MLLSLLTLGVWSAWATVRNRRYLYGNTEFAGDFLDFHGNPLAILRGRILAVTLFSAYALGGDFYFAIPVVAFSLLIVLFPWILTSALRFRLSNTSWRNLRFDFSASSKTAYSQLGFPMFLLLVAYGLFFLQFQWVVDVRPGEMSKRLFSPTSVAFVFASFVLVPLAIHRIRDLVMNHTRYGEHGFIAELALSRFFVIYGKSFFAGLVAVICAIIAIGAITGGLFKLLGAAFAGKFGILVVVYFLLIPAYLFPFAVWKVTSTNYVISSTHIQGLQFKMEMKVWPYWWILVSNGIIAVFSAGLAIPWTQIRMLDYKLSCLTVQGEIPVFRGGNVGKQTASGDEIGDAFDIDFGF